MKIGRNYYFLIGLALFYLLSFLSPSRIIYFASYFVALFFFYKATNDIQKSLLYSLILSLFSDFGLAKSLFIMQPQDYNLGPGWSVSPMSVFILCLLPFTLFAKVKKFHRADKFVILFFAFSLISFFIFPYVNVLYGIISLAEVILAYFILRIQLSKDDVNNISIILISLMIFQVILSGVQFILHRPVGQIMESVTIGRPYGITTVEEAALFRVSGTYSHPNFLASFILITYPFILLYPAGNIFFNLFKILAIPFSTRRVVLLQTPSFLEFIFASGHNFGVSIGG